ACITHQEALGVELGAELVDQLLPVTLVKPSILLAGIETKRCRAKQSPCRILANVIILGAVAHLDRAVLDGVEHLQRGYDLAARQNFTVAVDLAGSLNR